MTRLEDERQGAIIGAIVAVPAWIFANGWLIFTPNPFLVRVTSLVVAILLLALSIVAFFYSLSKGEPMIGETADYGIYGFTAVFDMITFIITVLNGHLPSP